MEEHYFPLAKSEDVTVGEWLEKFLDDDCFSVKRRLQLYWNDVKTTGFRELAAELLKADEFGIVLHGEGVLFGQEAEVDGKRIGDRWYLPCRDESIDFVELIQESSFKQNLELVEFLTYFGGLGDDLYYSGRFIFGPPFRFFSKEMARNFDYKISNFEMWEGALMLFEALDGTVALIRFDNLVAWFIPQELRVELVQESLNEFIQAYANARARGEPFCAYLQESLWRFRGKCDGKA